MSGSDDDTIIIIIILQCIDDLVIAKIFYFFTEFPQLPVEYTTLL